MLFMTIFATVGLVFASFGGNIPPADIRGICLMVLSFPAWAILMIILTILNAIWHRKALIICIITLIACSSALWEFFPLNIFSPSESDYNDEQKFTMLTYNVCNYTANDSIYPNGENRTISYILRTDADIVNLQESEGIFVGMPYAKATSAQIDSLHSRYPYMLLYGRSQMVLSKYPVEAIPTGNDVRQRISEIAVFRVDVNGTPITLINTHLYPYRLTTDDKSLYQNITELNRADSTTLKDDLKGVRSQLLSKIQKAAENRAIDAERIGRYIKYFGGPNVIIAGDFNDVPGCYTLRRLKDFEMRDAYSDAGFGPMITYHANRFYFRIDHVLYRGCIKPLKMTRGDSKSSDHYPLLTTFAITENKE